MMAMFEEIDQSRRHFLGLAAATIAGSRLAINSERSALEKTSTRAFDRVKQIDADAIVEVDGF